MNTLLLIAHGLAAVALLGAITHQAASAFRQGSPQQPTGVPLRGFTARYAAVNGRAFARPVAVLYGLTFIIGAIIYPVYRIEVRIPFEEIGAYWAVGAFELKEHWAGLGIALLPWYLELWRGSGDALAARRIVTATLAMVVWFDFLSGHVLNNLRGLP